MKVALYDARDDSKTKGKLMELFNTTKMLKVYLRW